MSYGFGLLVEGMVAVLLVLTICYCITLNGRLKQLKADERALKTTIGELIMATESAERAVAGLKTTARESEVMLGDRLRAAERLSAELERHTRAGEVLLQQFGRGPAAAPDTKPIAAVPDTKSMAAAAQAFAERARQRVNGLAA